jgi:SAM-dependent methyltransferase/tetratricopeptide (TPR) repeat protein
MQDIPEALNRAIQHYEAGRLHRAADIYRQVLAIDPSNADANHLLGVFFLQCGKTDEAVRFIKSALATNPNLAMAHHNLGIVHYLQGRMRAAVACFRRSLLIQPQSVEAYNYLGLIHASRGLPEKSIACYIKALSLRPDDTQACMGFSSLVKGRTFRPDHVNLPRLRDILITCLDQDNIEYGDLATASLSILLTDDVIHAIDSYLKNRTAAENDRAIFDDEYLSGLLHDHLFLLLLRKTIIADKLIEKFLTKVRKSLLMLVTSGDYDTRLLVKIEHFLYSLAHQCFLNEYVYFQSRQEQASVGRLVAIAEDAVNLANGEAGFCMALLGCYTPLSSLKFINPDTGNCINKSEFQDLITLQVRNPALEKAIIPTIPRFAEISDDISRNVREQYEENPYPRWIGLYRNNPAFINHFIQRDIHPNSLRDTPVLREPAVLIAGSGTGRHAIGKAMQYAGASVLAVDLSLASLAYARRKAYEYGVRNIEFLQADILDLYRFDRKFDVIECSGVLHHTADPVKAWKILVGLLKPEGYMKIGLYSEYARHAVFAAHEFIREHGYKATIEDIRKCRKKIFELPEGSDVREISTSLDFYTTSAVRDLLFHVQEHCFTIPKIAAILDYLNLRLLGFHIGNDVKRDYLEKFPDDSDAVTLCNWDVYEQENPDTFAGMYLFWVEKAGRQSSR